jgi:hypothetical protein
MAQIHRIERQERESQRREARGERKAWREVDSALDELAGDARRAATAALTAEGYHRHKMGERRKKRVSGRHDW